MDEYLSNGGIGRPCKSGEPRLPLYIRGASISAQCDSQTVQQASARPQHDPTQQHEDHHLKEDNILKAISCIRQHFHIDSEAPTAASSLLSASLTQPAQQPSGQIECPFDEFFWTNLKVKFQSRLNQVFSDRTEWCNRITYDLFKTS